MGHSSKKLKWLAIALILVIPLFLATKNLAHIPLEKGSGENMKEVAKSNLAFSLQAFLFERNDFVDVSKKTKEALVNIICIPKSPPFFAISGTGVIVDPRGVVLTNAHIGQYFLLKDFTRENFIDCVIRTGNPAQARYKATLFYIPETWVSKNYATITELDPVGTGENDFALLLIDQSIDPRLALPASFPYLPMNFNEVETRGIDVLATGYPAGVLGGVSLNRDLFSVSAVTKINAIQSFDGRQRDFLLLSASTVGERGSSGGSVVDKNGNLIGLNVTVRGGVGLLGELGSLSMTHINRSIFSDTGLSLAGFLAQNLDTLSADFKKTRLPTLTKIYSDNLGR
ncbi:MAG: serine protease [Candidatus Taylorbacteria bacterium]